MCIKFKGFPNSIVRRFLRTRNVQLNRVFSETDSKVLGIIFPASRRVYEIEIYEMAKFKKFRTLHFRRFSFQFLINNPSDNKVAYLICLKLSGA